MFLQDIDRFNGPPDVKVINLIMSVQSLLCISIMSIMSEVF